MCARNDEQFSRCPCDNPLFKSFSGLKIEISAECIDERQFSGETLLNESCITKQPKSCRQSEGERENEKTPHFNARCDNGCNS
jgi:hypothetical protein